MSSDSDSDGQFYRQAHPSHLSEAGPSSQAFNPMPKDAGKLSVDDASKVSAEESHRHFTEDLGFSSAGSWAVSAGEISGAGELKIVANPINDASDPAKSNPAHSLIDFNDIGSKGQRKRCAQILAICATARGCLFQASA